MPELLINGYKHYYEEVGEGTPMIWVTGTRFDSAKKWVDYMKENAHGFRMIMPDIRGMADSEHVAECEPSDWVLDLRSFLDELGIDSVHLASETLGTRIVTRFAYENPARVKSLILNGPIAYSDPEGDEDRVRQADPSNITPEALARLEYYHGSGALDVNLFYVKMHAKPEFHEYYDLRTIASEVKTPTLILRGDMDEDRHPVGHANQLHKLFPNSWLQIFANTSFNGMLQHTEKSWELIRSLVESTE